MVAPICRFRLSGLTLAFGCLLWAICSSLHAADVPPEKTLNLPGYVPLGITDILFQRDPPKHIMGEGFACYIVKVKRGEIDQFLAINAKLDPNWRPGSLALRGRHLRVLEWLEKWMKAAGVHDQIDTILRIQSLKDAPLLHYRLEYKENSDGDLTDAKMWVLLPERDIACIICMNT